MKDEQIENYSIVFYKKGKVVSVGNITSSKSEVRNLVGLLANTKSKYLPNKGKFDLVGFVKSFDLEKMAELIENEPLSYKKALDEIAATVCTPGEKLTDGECIDMIFSILTKNGYNMEKMQKKIETEYKKEGK